jgi:chitinase
MTAASTSPVTVKYVTTAGTAKAPADFTTKTGTLTIAAGKTSGTIVVPIVGDTVKEANETFTVTLSQPTNAGLADAAGTGTIVNED